jgi:hypothetical protein
MDEMQNQSEANTKPNPMDDPQTAALYQQKAEELQQLVAQQVMQGDTSQPTTMTEILADEQGAFAAKAQELGMQAEFQAFREAQQPIAAMREEFLAIEEQRSADANKVANIAPQVEQESAAARKSGGIGGLIGAAVAGIAGAFGAGKVTKSKPLQMLTAAAAAVFGGAVASIFTARKRAQKGMEKIEAQVGDMSAVSSDPALEQKAAELQTRLGEAQQASMQTMADAMVERMAEQELAAQQQAAAATQVPEPMAVPEAPLGEIPPMPEVATPAPAVEEPAKEAEPQMSPELAVRAENPTQSHVEALQASREKADTSRSL